MKIVQALLATASIVTVFAAPSMAADEKMSFFITSVGGGKGGDLGGLAGADAHCSKLAAAAGVSGKTWRAYLSTTMVIDRSKGRPYKITAGVNARDRIGKGPWHNAKGQLIAKDVGELHSASAKIDKQMGLDEKGNVVNARGDKPNKHDILTGSDPQGRYSTAGGDTTCGNWTSS
ncbi:MAG: lectin, partial [Hyphomicrobiaceae bacterium]